MVMVAGTLKDLEGNTLGIGSVVVDANRADGHTCLIKGPLGGDSQNFDAHNAP